MLLGYSVHYLFVLLLAGLVDASLPSATVWPVVMGMGMGLQLGLGQLFRDDAMGLMHSMLA